MLNDIATLESRSRVNYGNWKWYHSIDWIRFPLKCSIVYISNIVPKTFWDIRLQMCHDLENWVSGPSRSSKMSPFYRAHMTSYWRSIATMGLSRAVSEIDGNFHRESKNFPNPSYFVPRWKGFHWNWVSAQGVKKTRVMGLPGGTRSLTISLAVWIQSTNVTDGQTDGQTPGDSKDVVTHSVAHKKN